MPKILPLTYFGSIDYFRQLSTGYTVIDLDEHFIKQTPRSRCEILSANGNIHLSIPVTKPNGSKTAMRDIRIAYATDWQRTHWRSMVSAYASAPFFEDYSSDIKTLIDSRYVYLKDLNLATIEIVNKWLDLHLRYETSSQFIDDNRIYDFYSSAFEDSAIKPYFQLFAPNNIFIKNLSILDLIFSEGPMARKWLIP